MTTYAIFSSKHDSEIWVNLKVGTLESMETVRELVIEEMNNDPSLERGYVESYPFFQADWVVMGGRIETPFDFNQILEVENDHGTFEESKQFECFWGDGYRADDNKSILAYYDQDFFNQDRGYGEMECHMISTLEKGDSLDISDVSGHHWVRRIK